jgi:hypothetical protein
MGNILNIINSDEHYHNVDNVNYIPCLTGPFICSELRNFTINELTLDKVKDEKYIYVIEIRCNDGLKKVFDLLPQKLIDLVNNDKCSIVIDYEHEGNLDRKYLEKFQYNIQKNKEKVKLKNIFILTGNLMKLEGYGVDIIPSMHFLNNMSFDAYDSKFRRNTDLGYVWKMPDINKIDIDKKSKLFLTFIRNSQKLHRKTLASYYQYHDLWKDNNISFLKVEWDGPLGSGEIDYLPNKYQNSLLELEDLNPIEIDTKNLKDKRGFNTMFADRSDLYLETFFSVVSETLFNLHPFIVMSTPHTLKKLRELGFKTFGSFIDETYDEVEDNKKRVELIFKELDKIRTTPIDELKGWWKSIVPILEHNQKHFLNLMNMKTSKAKLLEKIND